MKAHASNGSLLKLQHDFVPSTKRPIVTGYDLAKLGFFLFGFPNNGFGSIDVSKECNLRSRHCYFFEQDYESELSEDDVTAKLEAMNAQYQPWQYPFFQC